MDYHLQSYSAQPPPKLGDHRQPTFRGRPGRFAGEDQDQFDSAGRHREEVSPDIIQPEPQTFIFSELPPEEKVKFMDFLLTNDVEFQIDPEDKTYVATIKIVNKSDQNSPDEYGQEVINGMDQMRQFSKQGARPNLDEQTMLQHQIQDLTKFQNKLKQHDEQESVRDMSRNRLQGSRSQRDKGDGLATGQGTMESKQSSRTATRQTAESRPSKSPTPGTGKSTPAT